MMTRRRLAAFVVKLMLATLSVGHVCVGQVKSTPEFTVRAQKESFKLGEKVVLVFRIENITHHSVLVSRIFALDKHVWLRNDKRDANFVSALCSTPPGSRSREGRDHLM